MKCFHHHLWMPSCLHVAATSVLLLLNLELVAVDDFDVFFLTHNYCGTEEQYCSSLPWI
jgi:hypothetical protein